jgi:LacI family transcriptional regulator
MRKIGVIIPGVVNADYLGELYRGVADAVKENRCSLVTNIQNVRRQDDLSPLFGRNGCDGAVVIVPYNADQVIARCRENNFPCVLVDYAGERDNQLYPTVETTNRAGIVQVVEHLLALGHRRIGFITGAMNNASAQQRLQGYYDALEAGEIVNDPALVIEGSWLPSENYVAAQTLLRLSPRPTAIIASSDIGAFAVYRAARERGLEIGRQISITGFDDTAPASTSQPPLTTVRQPTYRLGRVAVEMLLSCVNGTALPEKHVQLETQLIVRESTGRVPSTF